MRRAGMRTDHPRIRGEHTHAAVIEASRPGSSPHTRGAPWPPSGRPHRSRIIPAYAGSTARRRALAWRMTDHPRIRGEHLSDVSALRGQWGSSPHTRGAPLGSSTTGVGWRIIPAYAGSTTIGSNMLPSLADHPRIRGEHTGVWDLSDVSAGSSPHTRGARVVPRRQSVAERIIPAYAGSTTASWMGDSSRTDHPRIRGEHPRRRAAPAEGEGSSPHTRGARAMDVNGDWDARIIPAYAGSTFPLTVARGAAQDHPRIRGEHPSKPLPCATLRGSSPHTRGARLLYYDTDSVIRIIPAYAGSTGSGRTSSRGNSGSSPHTRGARRR